MTNHNEASGDYLRLSNCVLHHILPCSCLHIYPKYFQTVSSFNFKNQKENCCKMSDHTEGRSSFTQVHTIPYTLHPIHLASSCIYLLQSDSIVLSGHNFFEEINLLLLVLHICVRDLELHTGSLVIVAIWHSTNHNHESYIWQLWEVTCRFSACKLPKIGHWSLVASPLLLRCLPTLACTILPKHLNPLSLIPFGIIKTFQREPVFKSHQKICNHCLPVQGSISKLFQMVLSPDNGPILLLQQPSYSYFLSLVKCTKVGLPHPFGKLLQREFHLLQADWGFVFCTADIRQMLAMVPNSPFGSGYGSTRNRTLQWVLPHEKPEPLEMGRFYHQKPGISSSPFWLQLSV